MAPVISTAVDAMVPQQAQAIATWATVIIAAASVIAILRYCAKHRIWWPLLIVASGAITFFRNHSMTTSMGCGFSIKASGMQ